MPYLPNRRRDAIPLPSTLNGRIALCAQPCLVNYVNQYWVPQPCANSSSSGLDCLCDNYSQTGYALGEIALQCVSGYCAQPSSNQLAQARDLCASQPGAVPPTHSSVLVSVSVILTNTDSSSALATRSSQSVSSSTLPGGGVTTTAASPAAMPTMSEIPASRSGTSSATATTAAATPTGTTAQSGSSLTTAQAAGIAVGAFGGLGLAVSLIFCCLCCWRRKKKNKAKGEEGKTKRSKKQLAEDHAQKKEVSKKPAHGETHRRHSYDFRCASTPRLAHLAPQGNAGNNAFVRTYGPAPDPFVAHGSGIQDTGLGYHAFAIASQDRQARNGAAPEISGPVPNSRTPSPYSIRSERTTSRLLPSKRPAETTQATTSRPFSVTSRYTVFEEDQIAHNAQPPSIPAIYQTDRIIGSGECRQAPQVVDVKPPLARRRSMRTIRNLKLKLTIPPNDEAEPSQLSASGTATGRGLKSANVLPSSSRRLHIASPTSAPFPSAGSNMSYLPSYYMSSDSRTPDIPLKSPARLYQNSWPIAPPQPAKFYSKAPRQPRLSKGSDTTFESVDPDEVTPPEETEEKKLNGGCSSPITDLRYPKIPRSANQSCPRSPPILSSRTGTTPQTPVIPLAVRSLKTNKVGLGLAAIPQPSSRKKGFKALP
ncbi:hypothetical protein K461DRAFT_277093 [Myriangium duriaei CBS 260.36]|uniref:Extracellular membrane protein CFEM domain-containing protein n=1 Tax=Myriangium duriaei CBS 260.36 TaxID=1168546 RepID=A0A9P4J215_9PEZI|nr:hypothetical protein K461DRAFT_277093 [Myriangium duriaei CBS 260.36]